MNLYDRYLLPMLVHRTCSATTTMRQRAKVVLLARGDVLEVGFGSGLNLPFYDPSKVTKLWGLDPSAELTRMALQAARDAAFEVKLVPAGSEEIPLDADRFDTAVLTYTLCTIPSGALFFCEHGLAPDASVRRWQSRLNAIWRRVSGGCHLNRDVPALLERGGFEITEIETMYLPGWRVASYQYRGTAVAQLPTSSP